MEILETKKYIEDCKKQICTDLLAKIKGKKLYHVTGAKPTFKGEIIGCSVKCFKEYLQCNSVAVDIRTERNGEILVVKTLIECIYDENVGYDYFVTDEEVK